MIENPKVLAIDPGTREIGAAVFEGRELTYYAVRTVRERGTAQRVLRSAASIITELIETYKPQYFAIEKMFIVQKSAALLSITAEEMKSVARDADLGIYEYAPKSVRKFICQNGSATKADVAKVIAGLYPELTRYLNTRNKWDTEYYSNIFDAVAVGLMCLHQLSVKTSADLENANQLSYEESVG